MDEEVLSGGVANEGRVLRVGSRVHRPAGPYTESIHAYLRSLNSSGFEGASVPQGFDDVGREVLTFLAGDVAIPPYPEWAQSDAALGSIARLIARMHRSGLPSIPQRVVGATSWPTLGVGRCCATTTSAWRTSSSVMG